MPRKSADQQRLEERLRQRRHRAKKAGKPTPKAPAPKRDAKKAHRAMVQAVDAGKVARAQVIGQLWAEARDRNSPPGARVSALRALDDILPPDPPEEERTTEPTPADARRLIAQEFGDDVASKGSPEVDALVSGFPDSHSPGASGP